MKNKNMLWALVSVVGVVGVIVSMFLNTWSMLVADETVQTIGMFGSFEEAVIKVFNGVGDKTFAGLWSVLVYILAIVLAVAVLLGIVLMFVKTNKKNKKAIELISKICKFVAVICAILILICGCMNCIANNVAGKLTETVYKVVANEGFYILAISSVLAGIGYYFAAKK